MPPSKKSKIKKVEEEVIEEVEIEVEDDDIEDDIISSDIEDNDDIEDTNIKKNKKDDDEDEDDEDEKNEKIDEEYIIERKKLHHVKFTADTENNTIIVVKSENRITSDHMTTYEYTSVVGTRATHISKGAPIYVEVGNLYDPRDIAKKEIDECKCPLSITRKLGNTNKIEIWAVNEMIKPIF